MKLICETYYTLSASADAAEKVDLICKNYSTFLGTVESFTEGLKYMIENEKEYNRKASRGELGVRVQGSSKTHSNVTEELAINRVITREAIMACDFSGGVLDGVDREEEVREQAMVLRSMRRDFELFNQQLGILNPKEVRVFRWYLTKEKDLYSIATEEGIEYNCAVQKVRRMKEKVKIQMIVFLESAY